MITPDTDIMTAADQDRLVRTDFFRLWDLVYILPKSNLVSLAGPDSI